MRIGILTYHSEMNYGCTLQAYAMQEAYRQLGHEPIIIDRYITSDNSLLLGPLARKGFKSKVSLFLKFFLGVGTFSMTLRVLKTLRFHKRFMNKTLYSFYDWNDAPTNLGVDMISVGSDQIWNANLYSPVPYLLKYVNPKIPRISYAASIGMPELSPKYIDEYREGFARFKAISVRERQAVQLVNSLGFEAKQVVDPTLLAEPSTWSKFKIKKTPKRKRLLCYTLAEDIFMILPILEEYSKKNNCDVILLPDRFERFNGWRPTGLYNTLKLKMRIASSPVKLYISAAIEDFMREISAADWIVTNSYHAMMFSVIYRRNVRIIVPTDPVRKGMHARMEEFSNTIINGPLMQPDIKSALQSFENGDIVLYNEEELQKRIEESRSWLKYQLKIIENVKTKKSNK